MFSRMKNISHLSYSRGMQGTYKTKEKRNGVKVLTKKCLGLFFSVNDIVDIQSMEFKIHWTHFKRVIYKFDFRILICFFCNCLNL
jgi:hypothetical protein